MITGKFNTFFSISYVMMTLYFFSNWLRFTFKHPNSLPEDKFLSFIMFAITSLLWPLVVPVSCIKIIKKRELEIATAVPVVLAAIALSISLCLS